MANSEADFIALLESAPAMIYEVYDKVASSEIEGVVEELATDELLYRFNMAEHSEEGRASFCMMSDFERRAFRLPEGKREIPLPYFASHVRSVGRVEIAWSLEEVSNLIDATIEEKIVVAKIRQAHKASEGGR